MDSKRWSWSLLAGLGVAAVAQPYLGCLPDNDDDGPGETQFEASEDALADVGTEVVVPALDRFLTEMDTLRSALEAQVNTPDDRSASQAAFLDAMDAWQELEVMQLGPAGSSIDTEGGADLRDLIYSWPTVNPCRVDQVTASEAYASPTFIEDSLVNSYGLDVVAYLLFAPPGDNDCPSFTAPNKGGEWAALGAATVAERRVDYALVAVDAATEAAETIRASWTSEDGFGTNLATAGSTTSTFEDDNEALNAIFDAMFYVEKITKDAKLATPLGIRPQDCSASCEERLEATLTQSSTRWIVANLRGFRNLFTGGEGAGFDDLLIDQGDQDLVDRILANTDAAIALGEQTDPLSTLLPADPAPVQALHDAVKLVSDDLKGDLATLLALQIPAEAAGDND